MFTTNANARTGCHEMTCTKSTARRTGKLTALERQHDYGMHNSRSEDCKRKSGADDQDSDAGHALIMSWNTTRIYHRV